MSCQQAVVSWFFRFVGSLRCVTHLSLWGVRTAGRVEINVFSCRVSSSAQQSVLFSIPPQHAACMRDRLNDEQCAGHGGRPPSVARSRSTLSCLAFCCHWSRDLSFCNRLTELHAVQVMLVTVHYHIAHKQKPTALTVRSWCKLVISRLSDKRLQDNFESCRSNT